MPFTDIATLVLIQLSFVFSLSFLLWFGITRRWQDTAYGVNLFLVALSTVIILIMAEISLFWEDAPWRGWVRVVGWSIFAFTWGQRVYFLARDNRKANDD